MLSTMAMRSITTLGGKMRRDEAIAFMLDTLRSCREVIVYTVPQPEYTAYVKTVMEKVNLAMAIGQDAYQPPKASSLEALEEEVLYLRKRIAAMEKQNNIKAGADIHAGDGGYSEGNWEDHTKFVEKRNKSYRHLCDATLRALLGKEELVEKWWSSYNKAFDRTPEEQWSVDPMVVYQYLMQKAEGEW